MPGLRHIRGRKRHVGVHDQVQLLLRRHVLEVPLLVLLLRLVLRMHAPVLPLLVLLLLLLLLRLLRLLWLLLLLLLWLWLLHAVCGELAR